MKCKFNFKGKKIEIEVREMKGINKALGLMVYRRDALFFRFNNQAIHSIFCPRFLALWLDNNDGVVKYKLVEPWQFVIKPKDNFSKLIEIPISKRYEKVLSLFGINIKNNYF